MSGLFCCALSGHRDLPENFDKNRVYDDLERIIQEGYTTFYCGMAMGFDLLALECLIDLKERYHVRIDACIPFRGQERKYPAREKKRYENLLARCDVLHILSDSYFQGCFLARDRFMVERSDLLYAYCTREEGGTAYTVNYAKSRGVEIRKYGE